MPLGTDEVISKIEELAGDESTNFQKMSQKLIDSLKPLSGLRLLQHLEYAGIIPERYGHDSTEEKLYAKYCDYLLAESLSALGLVASVIQERADAPDVIGKSNERYKIAGDAKGFRLSRTAKNQKDFKVEALNSWRDDANYACLVCPIFQYPTRTSQIYSQARRYNVTLLSYTHLHLMVKSFQAKAKPDIEPLWNVPKGLPMSNGAETYWKAIDAKMLELASASQNDWQSSKKKTSEALAKRASVEIAFWESEKRRLQRLSKEELVKQLIEARRIDSNIETIRRISQSSF